MDYRLICLDFLSVAMRCLVLGDDYSLSDAFESAAIELGFNDFSHFMSEFSCGCSNV